jgi:hypothetical protein
MSKADISTTPILPRCAVLAGIASAAVVPIGASASAPLDGDLLKLEEQIFEQYKGATAFDDEIHRLHEIWVAQFKWIEEEARQGRSTLTSGERWALIGEMPETKEHTRLATLQEPFNRRMSELIKQMWRIPARTSEGRRAKAAVLLFCIMGAAWQETDKYSDYDIEHARALLIEFVGGAQADQLREQLAQVQS